MIISASLCDKEAFRGEAAFDRKRVIRDAILCALEDAGRAMHPHEISRITGIGMQAVIIGARNWPRYFTTEVHGDHVTLIDRHFHLKIGV